jgi:hypothetical protein
MSANVMGLGSTYHAYNEKNMLMLPLRYIYFLKKQKKIHIT